jgi:hypothetical protein
VLASDLTHDLHQTPGKRATSGFAFIGDCAASQLRLDVARVESWLVAKRPTVPGRFLLDDRADKLEPEWLLIGDLGCEENQVRRSVCRVNKFHDVGETGFKI